MTQRTYSHSAPAVTTERLLGNDIIETAAKGLCSCRLCMLLASKKSVDLLGVLVSNCACTMCIELRRRMAPTLDD